jgi:hypothetical protein
VPCEFLPLHADAWLLRRAHLQHRCFHLSVVSCYQWSVCRTGCWGIALSHCHVLCLSVWLSVWMLGASVSNCLLGRHYLSSRLLVRLSAGASWWLRGPSSGLSVCIPGGRGRLGGRPAASRPDAGRLQNGLPQPPVIEAAASARHQPGARAAACNHSSMSYYACQIGQSVSK